MKFIPFGVKLQNWRQERQATFQELEWYLAARMNGPTPTAERLESLEQGALPTPEEKFALEFFFEFEGNAPESAAIELGKSVKKTIFPEYQFGSN